MTWIFSTDGFAAKMHCGASWSPELLWIYAVANFIAFVIYQSFPILLLIYIFPRHLKAVRPALKALVLFISTCGLTHLMEMLTVFWPAYRLVTFVHVVNGITSITGLVWLFVAISRIRFIRPRAELEEMTERLKVAVKDVQDQANHLAVVNSTQGLEVLSRAILALERVKHAVRI